MTSPPPRVPKLHAVLPQYKGPRINTEKVRSYLASARKLYQEGKYVKAHAMYVAYLENLQNPMRCDPAVRKEFLAVAGEITHVLEDQDQFEEQLKIYLQSINFFPDDYYTLNKLGAFLFRCGETDIAKKYIKEALRYNEDYLPAEKNLLYIKWVEIPRWHFRMLNDYKRNKAYHDAIDKAITVKGHKCIYDIGAGCGLLSLFASYKHDTSVLAIEENKTLADMLRAIMEANNITNVELLSRNSSYISTARFKGSLMVFEIFDVALFGEFAIDTLVHAIQKTSTVNFDVIPARATLYVTGISSMDLLRRYRLVNDIKSLGLVNICVRQRNPDPYEAENLNELNVTYRTETVAVLCVDFKNLDQLVHLKNGYKQIVSLKCIKRGAVHAIAVWFDLHLDDEITITTDPNRDPVKCWEQAVFHLEHSIFMETDEVLLLEMSIENSQVSFKVLNQTDHNCNCFLVSKEVISYLNDKKLVKAVSQLAAIHCKQKVIILDFEPFPLFGFLMAKHGSSFCHGYTHKEDIRLVEHIKKVNNVPIKDMMFVVQKHMAEFVPVLQEVDMVIWDPININGNYSPMQMQETYMKKWQPLILPLNVHIELQLVETEYLYYCNKVDDRNVLNFRIGEFMNEYTGDEHPYLETLPACKFLSLPHKHNLSNMKNGTYEVSVQVKNSGQLTGIYYWFDLEYHKEISFKTLHSFYYNKTCVIVKEPRTVAAGDKLKLRFHKDNDVFKVALA